MDDGADVVEAAVAATGDWVATCPLGEDWSCSTEIRVCMKLPSACNGFELDALVDAPLAEVADDVPDMPDWDSAWKMADTKLPT